MPRRRQSAFPARRWFFPAVGLALCGLIASTVSPILADDSARQSPARSFIASGLAEERSALDVGLVNGDAARLIPIASDEDSWLFRVAPGPGPVWRIGLRNVSWCGLPDGERLLYPSPVETDSPVALTSTPDGAQDFSFNEPFNRGRIAFQFEVVSTPKPRGFFELAVMAAKGTRSTLRWSLPALGENLRLASGSPLTFATTPHVLAAGWHQLAFELTDSSVRLTVDGIVLAEHTGGTLSVIGCRLAAANRKPTSARAPTPSATSADQAGGAMRSVQLVRYVPRELTSPTAQQPRSIPDIIDSHSGESWYGRVTQTDSAGLLLVSIRGNSASKSTGTRVGWGEIRRVYYGHHNFTGPTIPWGTVGTLVWKSTSVTGVESRHTWRVVQPGTPDVPSRGSNPRFHHPLLGELEFPQTAIISFRPEHSGSLTWLGRPLVSDPTGGDTVTQWKPQFDVPASSPPKATATMRISLRGVVRDAYGSATITRRSPGDPKFSFPVISPRQDKPAAPSIRLFVNETEVARLNERIPMGADTREFTTISVPIPTSLFTGKDNSLSIRGERARPAAELSKQVVQIERRYAAEHSSGAIPVPPLEIDHAMIEWEVR